MRALLNAVCGKRGSANQELFIPKTVSRLNSGVPELSKLQAVILCGGLGTRLRSRIEGIPKCLAPIVDRPFLEYLVDLLVSAGLRRIIFCTGYGADKVWKTMGDGLRFEAEFLYSQEQASLGTAGALKLAEPLIDSETFFLVNGDSLFDMDHEWLMRKHRERGALATMALAQVEDSTRYGNVELGPGGEVATLREKPESTTSRRKSGWIYGGVCVADRNLLKTIPSSSEPVSLEREIFPGLIGCGLFGERFDGFFLDIGVPLDYERACQLIPARYSFARTHSS